MTCNEHDRPTTTLRELQAPRVVIEVLAVSTEAYDRGEKCSYYRTCPTLQEYVLVGTKYQLVEVFCRTPKGRTDYQVYGPGDEIELITIDLCIRLAALYELTDMPENLEPPDGEV